MVVFLVRASPRTQSSSNPTSAQRRAFALDTVAVEQPLGLLYRGPIRCSRVAATAS
jgi:hypothetical protein